MVIWAEGIGNAPISVETDPVFETGAASLYLPAFQKLAARVGLAPTPPGLTGRRATLTLSGNGAAGRILTCMIPLRTGSRVTSPIYIGSGGGSCAHGG